MAGVFAIALTVNTTRHAYQQMFADLTGRAALEVVAEGGGGFDRRFATASRPCPACARHAPSCRWSLDSSTATIRWA